MITLNKAKSDHEGGGLVGGREGGREGWRREMEAWRREMEGWREFEQGRDKTWLIF